MVEFTQNFNLEKPAQTDFYNVDVQNANMDKIDAALANEEERVRLHINDDIKHLTPEQREMYNTTAVEFTAHVNEEYKHTTQEEKDKWNAGVVLSTENSGKIGTLENLTNNHEPRIKRLEDAIFNNITGNPFLVSFENLENIKLVKGIWNVAQKRIEC